MKPLRLTLLAALLLPFAPAAPAQDVEAVPPTAPALAAADLPPLIDRELFFGDPEISGGSLSPDGAYIAFTKPYNDVMNVYVKGIDEPFEDARPITADDRPVRQYFWSQDGQYILYAQDKGGDEDYHVYAVDPAAEAEGATGVPAARDLTPLEGIRAGIVAVPESSPDEIVVMINDRDPAWHDLYRVNLETGERELLLQNPGDLAGFEADLDGTPRLATRVDPRTGDSEIKRIVAEGDGLAVGETIYTCDVLEMCGTMRFHPDGRRVYMRTNQGDRNLAEFVLLDTETGETELVERDPEGEVDFAGAGFSNRTDEPLVTYYVGDRVRLYPKTEAMAEDLAYLGENLPEGDIYPGSMTEDDRYMVVTLTRDVDPGSRYLFDRETREIELLYESRPELPTEHLAPMRVVRYEARDGLTIPAYLTLPKGVEPRNLPVVINPHGGPWARDVFGYDATAQFLANRGYAVLQPNFRGSAGFGKDFIDAGNKEWGTGAMQHDISDGVQYLIDEGIADPERVGIMGGSYGGYATLAGVAFTPELYAAGVSIVGPSNIITLLESIPPYWEAGRRMFAERVGDMEDPEERAMLEAQSPLGSADRIEDPLLVIQGANDPRVKQRESDQIVVALRERGFPVEYIVAPDEGHGFSGKENRLAMFAAVERFLGEHLGGRYQADMPADIREKLDAITVDPATVTITQPTDTAGMDAPAFDGAAVRPMSMRYDVAFEVQGQEMKMEDVTRTVTPAEHEGQPAYAIVDRAKLPAALGGVAILDSFVVAQTDLQPLYRKMQQGPGTITLAYTEGGIQGEMAQGGMSMPVNASLDGPVVADNQALEIGLSALPLEVGYTAAFQTFNPSPMAQGVKEYVLRVTGTEEVTVPAGTFETYVVELDQLDSAEDVTLYVSQEDGVAVKSVGTLPAAMGGGTVQSVLLEAVADGPMGG